MTVRAFTRWALAAMLAAALLAPVAVSAEERGPVTNLPLPRFVSMKASEGNVRRGPSLTHKVDWVFTRRDIPLQITAEYGHWRRVRDREGAGGWMHYSLLSGVRTVIVDAERVTLRINPEDGATPNAYAEQGVIARLGECRGGWCRISAGGHAGWVRTSEIWGVGADEDRD
jgi:SH3-like domain-containing protein